MVVHPDTSGEGYLHAASQDVSHMRSPSGTARLSELKWMSFRGASAESAYPLSKGLQAFALELLQSACSLRPANSTVDHIVTTQCQGVYLAQKTNRLPWRQEGSAPSLSQYDMNRFLLGGALVIISN